MDLPAGPYAVVVCDPPWAMGWGARLKRSGRTDLLYRRAPLPYKTMSDAAIAGLDMRGMLADSALVCLWCPSSRTATAQRVMAAWGVDEIGWRVWHKTDGGPQLPNRWRSDAEFVLVGKVGSPRMLSTAGYAAVFRAPRERRTDPCRCERTGVRRCTACPPRFEHSAKPAAFYADLAGRTPGPRLDMFARRRHPGWDAWGDEAPG